jgi:hypothetical protein
VSAPCPRFGFICELRSARAGADQLERAREAFEAFVEGRGLTLSVDRADSKRYSFVVTSEASQATEADRQAIGAWAGARGDVLVRVDDLMDLQAVA